jgi:hypothetical protein
MTIANETKRVQYAGNNSTTVFAYSLGAQEEDHVLVILRSTAGVDITLVKDTDYVQTLTDGDGTITTTGTYSPPDSGEILSIILDPDQTQEHDLGSGSTIPPQTLEDGLDKQTNISKRNRDMVERALQVPDGMVAPSVILPAPVGGNYLRWNAGATAIEGVSGQSTDEVFIQFGTGAVTRTVSGKLGEYVSVADFGATGDGITDDTSAIQAAIDAIEAIGGGSVLLPTGVYLVSDAITIDSEGVELFGVGSNILSSADATGASMFLVDDGSTADAVISVQASGVTLRDFGIDGNSAGRTSGECNGLHFYAEASEAFTGCRAYRVSVYDVYGNGVLVEASGGSATFSQGVLEDVSIDSCGGTASLYGIHLNTATDWELRNCISNNSSVGSGLYATASSDIRVIGGEYNSNAVHGVRLAAQPGGFSIIGATISENEQRGINVSTATGNVKLALAPMKAYALAAPIAITVSPAVKFTIARERKPRGTLLALSEPERTYPLPGTSCMTI